MLEKRVDYSPDAAPPASERLGVSICTPCSHSALRLTGLCFRISVSHHMNAAKSCACGQDISGYYYLAWPGEFLMHVHHLFSWVNKQWKLFLCSILMYFAAFIMLFSQFHAFESSWRQLSPFSGNFN